MGTDGGYILANENVILFTIKINKIYFRTIDNLNYIVIYLKLLLSVKLEHLKQSQMKTQQLAFSMMDQTN